MKSSAEKHIAKLRKKGSSLFRNERYREAAEAYRELTLILPDERDVWCLLAMALYEAGDAEGVRDALDGARKVYDKPHELVQEWSEYLWDAEDMQGAADFAVEEMERDTNHPWLQATAAEALIYAEREEGAEALVPRLLEYNLDETEKEAWEEQLDQLAMLILDVFERRDLADALWDRLETFRAEHTAPGQSVRPVWRAGLAQRAFGPMPEWEEAEEAEDLSEESNSAETDADGFGIKVPVPERTEDEWKAAALASPDDLAGYAGFLLNQGRLPEAREAAQKALLRRSTGPMAYLVLGYLAALAMDWKSAERSFKEAVRRGPDLPAARYALASAYLAQNQRKAADRVMESLQPSGESPPPG